MLNIIEAGDDPLGNISDAVLQQFATRVKEEDSNGNKRGSRAGIRSEAGLLTARRTSIDGSGQRRLSANEMNTANLQLRRLSSYIPKLILRRIRGETDTDKWSPQLYEFPGAILFMDVSGFTRLTDELAAKGPSGVEQMQQFLDEYFGNLIDVVLRHSGDIVAFAGDALFAVWPLVDEAAASCDLTTVTNNAAQAALEIQQRYNNHRVADGVVFSLRIALGAGDLRLWHVGGLHDVWQYIISGQPVEQIEAAQGLAAPGDVVATASAWELLSDTCTRHQLSERSGSIVNVSSTSMLPDLNASRGSVIQGNIRGPVDAVAQDPPSPSRRSSMITVINALRIFRGSASTTPAPPSSLGGGPGPGGGASMGGFPVTNSGQTSVHRDAGGSSFHSAAGTSNGNISGPPSLVYQATRKGRVSHISGSNTAGAGATDNHGNVILASVRKALPLSPHMNTHPSSDMEEAMRSYIFPTVLDRMEAGQTEWLSELRRVTVMFINMRSLEFEGDGALDKLQSSVVAIQEVLHQYEGLTNKMLMDDKGTTLIAVFGLPPYSHEDDAARGCMAALSSFDALKRIGADASIGVTTGQVFAGSYGNSMRREYTILGSTVNLAARLMMSPMADILCCRDTFRAAHSALEFEQLESITVKGKTEPIEIFKPLSKRTDLRRAFQAELVGRQSELASLTARVTELIVERSKGMVTVVEADAGMGKTLLAHTFMRHCESKPVRVALGAATSVEKSTPYFVWRQILTTLFELDKFKEGAIARSRSWSDLAVSANASISRLSVHNTTTTLSSNQAKRTSMARSLSGDEVETIRMSGSNPGELPGGVGNRMSLSVPSQERLPVVGESREHDSRASGMSTGIPELTGPSDAPPMGGRTPHRLSHATRSSQNLLSMDSRRQIVLAKLRDKGGHERADLAALLNTILPIDLPESKAVEEMSNQLRSEQQLSYLVAVIRDYARHRPLVLVLEDAQWLDSRSWKLALAVANEVPSALLVLTTRPMADPLPPDFAQLLERARTHRLILNPLSEDACISVVCQRLGVETLPGSVKSLIRDRAQGNPLFASELGFALRNAGAIEIDGTECRLPPGTNLADVELPDSVQGLIISKVDQLMPAHQFTLKVASVIGDEFSYRILADVHPLEDELDNLSEQLRNMRNLELIQLLTADPETYCFTNSYTRECIYNLMLFSQRRQLHAKVAEWTENFYQDDLTQSYPMLAYHYSKAEEYGKAMHFLELAGEHALRTFANAEAVAFIKQAIELMAMAPQHTSDEVRAHWERNLGQAYYAMGELGLARKHLQLGMQYLAAPLPRSRLALRWGTFRAITGHFARRLVGRPRVPTTNLSYDEEPTSERQSQQLELARLHERLSWLYFFDQDWLTISFVVLRQYNNALASGMARDVTRAAANMAMISSAAGLFEVAEDFRSRAMTIAQSLPGGKRAPSLARLHAISATYLVNSGEWARALEAAESSLKLHLRAGNKRRWEESQHVMAFAWYCQGQMGQMNEACREILASATQRGDVQMQIWAHMAEGIRHLHQARTSDGLAQIEALVSLEERHPTSLFAIDRVCVRSLVALGKERSGEVHKAREAIDESLELLADMAPISYLAFWAYTPLGEAAFSLLVSVRGAATSPRASVVAVDEASITRSCREILRHFGGFVRRCAIARPRFLLFRGLMEFVEGHTRKAIKTWTAALNAAEDVAMPYEYALVYAQLTLAEVSGFTAVRTNLLLKGSSRGSSSANGPTDAPSEDLVLPGFLVAKDRTKWRFREDEDAQTTQQTLVRQALSSGGSMSKMG